MKTRIRIEKVKVHPTNQIEINQVFEDLTDMKTDEDLITSATKVQAISKEQICNTSL